MNVNDVNKEDVEQFIREMKSVAYWSSKIRDINLNLEELTVKLQGVSSPAIKEVIYENAGDPYKNNKAQLIMEEEQLIRERNVLIEKIKEVGEIFNLIENDDDFEVRQCMIELYICKFKLDDIIINYSMHRMTIYRRINKSIINAMLLLSHNKNQL